MTWVALALLGLGLRTAAALSVGFVPAGEATRDACRMKCKITSDARDDVAAKTR